MPQRSTPEGILATLAVLKQRVAYEDEVCATPLGCASWSLRQKARALFSAGDEEQAFALYEQAAGMHADDDDGAAATMCRYDLAETYTRRRTAVRLTNLLAAERLYRRVLASPVLARDTHRTAMTQNALASCLRKLAQEPMNQREGEELLNESAGLFQEATRLAEHEATTEHLARYLHNWSNLEAQRGRLDAAIERMAAAEQAARAVEIPEEPGTKEALLSSILIHGAEQRLRRGGPTDVESAIDQLQEALEIAHPVWTDQARLRLCWALLDAGDAGRAETHALLRRVNAAALRPDELKMLVDAYERAGLQREALAVLRDGLERAMAEWRRTMANHTGHHAAAHAQNLAHAAARLLVANGDAFAAFTVLEYASGLRFGEVIGEYCERFKDPITREIHARYRRLSTLAAILETWAGNVASVPARELQAALQQADAELTAGPLAHAERRFDDGGLGIKPETFSAELKNAARRSDPSGHLRQRAHKVGEEARRYLQRLTEIEPSYRFDQRPWLLPLEEPLLRDLLREHRGYALIRLSLTVDLLVVGVWLDGDELVARAHRIPVPEGLLARLAAYQQAPGCTPIEAIAAELEALDLGPALPPHRLDHAVLLPSFLASFLPLPSVGPRGNTLLDRFDAISWMPCLAPLFERQAPYPPREGTLSVASAATRDHTIAFSVALSGEGKLAGAQATADQVAARARNVDVLCLYAHGRHAGERGPEIELHGGPLDRSWLDARWIGMERVELWACQTGVNLPSDPLTPPVDEAFGLDVEFVNVGVRSAIGTLWPVPDLVTACIVRRYRLGLCEGRPAPCALADAQRWWRDEAIPTLGSCLRTMPAVEALAAFRRQMGAAESVDTTDAEALLGPAPAGGVSAEQIERVLARLANPLSWAGFRFIGVAERRPLTPWTPEYSRALTADEQAEVERLAAQKDATPLALDEWQEEQLAQATALKDGSPPSPDQAIRVARLYRDRLFSSHRHNLLSGLAWLHEALSSIDTKTKGAKGQKQARNQLALEAAWLWIEMARGDALAGQDLLLMRPAPVAVARARQLLNGVPETVHVRVARAWTELLGADLSNSAGLDAALRRAWMVAEQALHGELPEGYEGLRTLTAACEIALLAPERLPRAVDEAFRVAAPKADARAWKPGLLAIGLRLRSLVALLGRSKNDPRSLPLTSGADLTPRELVREAMVALAEHDKVSMFASPPTNEINRYFDALEGRLWGYAEDDRGPLWRSTGTPGAGYRRLSGFYLAALAQRATSEDTVPQFLATLNLAADLHLVALSRWVRLFGPPPNSPLAAFWNSVRDRELLLDHAYQMALLPDSNLASETPRFEPHRLDPFRCTSAELVSGAAAAGDLLAWALGDFTSHRSTKTAAFAAVQGAHGLTRNIDAIWTALLKGEADAIAKGDFPHSNSLAKLFEPGLRIADGEKMLRQMPPGTVVLGLAIGPQERLVAASVWRSSERLEQRAHLSEAGVGFQAKHLLAQLHLPTDADTTPRRGAATNRTETWLTLRNLLGPALDAVLGAALAAGARRVAVLAPGALRPLPILGLHVGGKPLFEQASGVLHLPSLAAESLHDQGDGEACVLGRQRAEGDTSFGECAVETLRRWFEPAILRPPPPGSSWIVETEQLEPIARSLHSLRFYGVGSTVTVRPALSCMDLDGNRRWVENNTRDLFLPCCAGVEIWAATSGLGPMEAILRDDEDRIPGLARAFLLSGATGALDLAWPVHDLVKALVCERFNTLQRRRGVAAADALTEAVTWSAALLGRWRGVAISAPSIRDALGWLDDARRAAASDAGLPSKAVVPFAACQNAPSIAGKSASEIADEVSSPVHFAAFRLWGWFR